MNQSQPHNTGNALVTRTVLEDKSQINRTASLPILLEKKSVEMKPRYEPKSKIFLRMRNDCGTQCVVQCTFSTSYATQFSNGPRQHCKKL